MITDALLKMELKFHSSVILSKFDRKSSKVNQVIFSAPMGIPNMNFKKLKALAKTLFEIFLHTRFSNFVFKGT